jgi:carbon storage regulator CsrA
MLVLTRRKNEAVLIGGQIRIEVAGLARASVRLRLTAPREFRPPRGVTRSEARPRDDRSEGALGIEVAFLTMVNQQTLALGGSISLGVLDADRSRVLLFVDAPAGTTVETPEREPPLSRAEGSRQSLLDFMNGVPDRPEPSPESAGACLDQVGRSPADPVEAPRLLPFPSRRGKKARG